MSVLVTGGAGYIGSHTCLELLNKGYDVIVVDNLCNSSAEALKRVEKLAGRTLTFRKLDLRDGARMDDLFREFSDIDCVIHFAGLKAVGESVFKPLDYYHNNLASTMVLCATMKNHGVKRIAFSSSATVYSSENSMPLTESSRTGSCTNPYGWTKYMCERMLSDITFADPSWSVALLRYFNPIGAHESGLIGEDPNGIPNNLMPYVSQTAIGKLDTLHVYGNDYPTPDGTGLRDYIHVVDLACGHIAALEYMSSHTGAEVFNLGTGVSHSVLDLVNTFERVNAVKVPYKIESRRPGDIAVCYADPSKSEKILGWKAQHDLEAMCRDAWHWQSLNPNGY